VKLYQAVTITVCAAVAVAFAVAGLPTVGAALSWPVIAAYGAWRQYTLQQELDRAREVRRDVVR
jgi:hypothetical protein